MVAPLFTEWLPAREEKLGDFPLFFHYVNVGPDVAEHEMITDVYLPLRRWPHTAEPSDAIQARICVQ
ncbi:MAG: hypothetical protein IRZ28_16625 [Steroidobacteraceae bacterium]|nr:hypothetical protein [Steroidobacteraceae bacterium]